MKEKNKKSLFCRRHIIAAVCFAFLVIIALVVVAIRWEPKPDPESERRIRHESAEWLSWYMNTDKDPNYLTDEDFAQVEYFEIDSLPLEICDIKLLEKFKSLKALRLDFISYPESAIPKWMKFLDKHGVINLEDRYAIDLSPIKNLTGLEYLNLCLCSISDITPLKTLINLEYLDIGSTNVSDLKPLHNLRSLKRLDIRGIAVSDKQIEELQKALPNCEIVR